MRYSQKLNKLAQILKWAAQVPEPMNPPGGGGTTRIYRPDTTKPIPPTPTEKKFKNLGELNQLFQNPFRKRDGENLIKHMLRKLPESPLSPSERDYVGAILEDLLAEKDIFKNNYEYKNYLRMADQLVKKYI